METIQLTNFNVPIDTRRRFDAICHASGRTRTSVLVELMTDYILHLAQLLAARNHQFQMVDELLGEKSVYKGERSFPINQTLASRSTTQTRSNREFDLPDFLVSDDQGDW